MKRFRLHVIFLLLTSLILCTSHKYNIKLIIDFFKHREIYFVNIHRCLANREAIQVLMEVYKNNIRSNMYVRSYFENYYFHHRFGFVTNVNCKNWNVFLQENLSHKLYRVQKHGFIFCDSDGQYKKMKERLDKFDFKLDSNIYIAVRINLSYVIYDVYNILPSTKHIFSKTSTYSNEKLQSSQLSRYEKRRNFGNVLLNVGFVVTKSTTNPEEYLSDQRTKQFDTSSKVNFGVFYHTVDIHNFRYNIVPTPGWFSSTRQGVEAGLGNVIFSGNADISGSSGLITVGRSEAFDFLVGTFLFRTCFLYRNLGVYGVVYNEFIKPFSMGTWLCTLAIIALFCLFFLATQIVEHHIHADVNKYSICSILLYILSAFCQQGATMERRSITSRSILLVLLVLSYLWYNYYTSSIVSSLINNKHETFKDVEALIKSDLRLGIENIAFKRIFNASNHPTLAQLQALAIRNNSKVDFYPQIEGIANIQGVGFAYLAEAIAAYNYIAKKFTNKEICDLNELETMRPTMLYLVGRKRGPLNEILSIRRFVQHGLVHRHNKIFCDEKPTCLNTVQFVQVGIEQAAPAFIILFFGYIISMILLILENKILKNN